jgi:site-specific DNA-cytosine methylase
MKVLIACEESQEVCKAFRELGHEAFSCDTLPCSGGHSEWHIKKDILEILEPKSSTNGNQCIMFYNEVGDLIIIDGWDLIIAFPPCTHLAVSGAKHFAKKIADGRQQEGIDFFMRFTNCKCPRVAIENPVGIMSSKYRKPDQIIQPYMFGHEAQKSTCLWLKGLPLLKPTNIVGKGKFYISPSGKKLPEWYNKNNITDGNRQKSRSKTFQGIAKAMATQWSEYLKLISEVKQ